MKVPFTVDKSLREISGLNDQGVESYVVNVNSIAVTPIWYDYWCEL